MKRILVIDGGGAKGPIPATVLSTITYRIQREIHQIFDLVYGTSVGAIIGGIAATGKMRMERFYPVFLEAIPEIFKPVPHIPFIGCKYSRKPMDGLMSRYIGAQFLMGQCATRFVCTSVNMVDGRTHFFKSWEDKDGKLTLLEALSRSYAAPLYFGAIKDKAGNAIWLDGGTGNMSSPTVEAFVEACRLGWVGSEPVHMLSIGCGQAPVAISYDEASKYRTFRQVYYFMSPMDGGLARRQCDRANDEVLRGISSKFPNFTFQRVEDYALDPKLDVTDGVKYLPEYMRIGERLGDQVDLEPLR